MKLKSFSQALSLVALALVSAAHAQTPLAPAPGVCATPLTLAQQKIVDATAFMIPKSLLVNNGNGTYKITNSPLINDAGNPPTPICATSEFYGVPSAMRGRTAVMIGGNFFLTAAHLYTFDPSGYALVFGPKYDPQNCREFSWNNIPANDVYLGTANGIVRTFDSTLKYDYISFQSDRYVVDRKPVKIRRSGAPSKTDPLILVGHPLWSSTAVETTGFMAGVMSIAGSPFYGDYLYSEFHPFDGSSGSAIYNLRDEVVDTGIARSLDGQIYDLGSCADFFSNPAIAGKSTNGPLVNVAPSIPRAEVLVTPTNDVTHVGDLGGPLTNEVSTYTISAALGGSNQYEIIQDHSSLPGNPTLSSSPVAGQYLLSLIHPTALTLTANAANVYQCGIWDYTVNVRDRYQDQNNYLRHHFEIGVKEISVEPSDRWDVEIFGSSVPASKTYTIKNLRPTPVEVKAAYSWPGVPGVPKILIDGGASSIFTLAPEGQPGDTKAVVYSVNPSAALPAAGTTHSAETTINITDFVCSLNDPWIIPVTLKTGVQSTTSLASGDFLNLPSSGNTLGNTETIELPITQAGGWCVSKVHAELGFLHDDALFAGLPANASVLDVNLIAPDGTRAHLWSLSAIPAGQQSSYIGSESVTLYGTQYSSDVLRLDDTTSPPLGPDQLAVFASRPVTGTWKAEIRRGAGNGVVMPTHARLRFDGVPCMP